ncbi:MAG TPA: hypothetical protein VKD72_15990 [Gemmataceae bacterium]|nr:hypothetical protein [Gemmataceae bacterium]
MGRLFWISLAPGRPILPPCSGRRRAVEGLLIRDEEGRPVVYMVCEPSTHSSRIMTGCDRMPVLVDQRY